VPDRGDPVDLDADALAHQLRDDRPLWLPAAAKTATRLAGTCRTWAAKSSGISCVTGSGR
jgi:hypothetical protein